MGLLLTVAAAMSRADTVSYAGERRQIKACVLVSNAASTVVNGNTVPENACPYVFYVLDKRADTRPAGWEFVNPLAATTISNDIYTRWQNRQTAANQDPAFVAGNPVAQLFHVGAPLTKNIGAYWEVNLDSISTDDLLKFDIVLMAYHNGTAMGYTPAEREKLRRFADSGGAIWLEDEGGYSIAATAGQFIVNVNFTQGLTGNPISANPLHPILNYPFRLTYTDILRVGQGAGPNRHLHTDSTINTNLANPRILVPVIGEGTYPYLSAGDFGGGHVVVSSAGIATDVNSYAGGPNVGGEGGNSGAVSGDNLAAVLPVDLKIAYNLIAWTSSIATASNSTRRVASTSEFIGADLAPKWATVPPATANTGYGSGAVMDKGVIFYVDGANVLHAYNANPGSDLDNDRNPDEGIVDYILGAPYDEIWRVDLTTVANSGTGLSTRVSTPTIATVYNTGTGRPQDVVIVQNSVGMTMAFDAFPLSGGVLAKTSPLLWMVGQQGPDFGPNLIFSSGARVVPAPSPAFSEGILFTLYYNLGTDPTTAWHIAPVDPITGNNVFNDPANGIAPSPQTGVTGLSSPLGALTVGYVRDESTGALDKVIYVPTGAQNGATVSLGAMNGVWFSTRNEPMTNPDPTRPLRFRAIGNRGHIPWYAPTPLPASDPYNLLPVIHIVTTDPVTGAVTGIQEQHYLNNDFQITYEGAVGFRDLIVTLKVPLGPNDTMFADYTIDWPDANVGQVAGSVPNSTELSQFGGVAQQFGRHFALFTPNALNAATQYFIYGTAALAPQDLLLFNSGDFTNANGGSGGDGDRLYAYRDQFNIGSDASGQPRPYVPEVAWMFAPNDAQNTGVDILRARLINTLNDPTGFMALNQAYRDFDAVGSPAVSNGIVYSIGFAHAEGQSVPANDATVILALNANPNTTFSIGQSLPPTTTLVTLTQVDVTQSTLGNPRYLRLTQDLSRPYPQYFTVDLQNGTIHILNFYTPDGSFNTALPIYVTAGGPSPIGPIVNSQTGYGPLDNVLWYMLIPRSYLSASPGSGPSIIGNALYFTSADGRIVSIDLPTTNPNGAQIPVFRADGTSRVHIQPILTDGTGNPLAQNAIHPPLGAGGIVAVGSPNGLSALDNQLTLITDNNRLIEVDHGVNAVWSLDSTTALTVSGGPLLDAGGNPSSGQFTGTKVSLSRPSVARHEDLNLYLVADTGNNRVIQVDKGGFTNYEIHNVANDMKFMRPGDPLTLNQPTDVQTFTETNTTGLTLTNPDTNVTYTFNAPYLATHYIIADSGNARIVEIVDAYDQTGALVVLTGSDGSKVTLQRQVIFVTRTLSEQNADFHYRTIQLFESQNGANPNQVDTLLATAVDNVRGAAINPGVQGVGLNGANQEGLGGSLMLLRRYLPNGSPYKEGDPAVVITSLAITNAGGTIVRHQPVSNPTWFKEFEVLDPSTGKPIQHYLLCDDNGCYDLIPNGTGSEALVNWMLSADDYYRMTGRRLRATSIQRLGQADFYSGTQSFYPRYLITNRYTGPDNIANVFSFPATMSGQVHGEVFEVRSMDYYTSTDANNVYNGYQLPAAWLYTVDGSGNPVINMAPANTPGGAIVWMVPKETILLKNDSSGNPIAGAYYIKRAIGSINGGTSTHLLEQPTYSDRP